MAGMLISLLSSLLVSCLSGVSSSDSAEASFTLMAIQFMLTGITLFSLGAPAEYVGRIYREVSRRPRYSVRKIFEHEAGE